MSIIRQLIGGIMRDLRRLTSLFDRVRAATYQTFARTANAPSLSVLVREMGEPPDAVAAAVRELADRHVFVLTPDGSAIERALPFSAVPTGYGVRAGERWWWANCIWDALAIPPLVGTPAVIETTCPDCESEIQVTVEPSSGIDKPHLVAHFLLPASRWYDDIRFT